MALSAVELAQREAEAGDGPVDEVAVRAPLAQSL
jgi:hypothetical protein